MLAGVVGSVEGGIAAVVGGEDQQIVFAHQRLYLGQLLIDIDQGVSEAPRIAAVSPEHIGINQVGEAQAVEITAHVVQPGFNAGGISGGVV